MSHPAQEIIALYRRHARAWSSARGSTLIEGRWLAAFAERLPAGGRVLDLGCGPGAPIARHLVEQGLRVLGLDSSPEMIALFRRNLPDQEAQVGDMRVLALGVRVDGILAWDSFFHLQPDEQRAMFPIFRDHARAGAPLMFTSGPRAGVAMGELEGEPLYHSSLDPLEYRALLAAHGFALVDHVSEDPACGGHTIWLAQRMSP